MKAGKRGALVELERKGDAAARAALAFGRRYASHRRAELGRAHGDLSAGVGAMIESAGDLLAASRYWSARAIAEANPDHARLAAQLAAGARQSERDGWALATLEAEARPRAVPNWLRAIEGDDDEPRPERARRRRAPTTEGTTDAASDDESAPARPVAPELTD